MNLQSHITKAISCLRSDIGIESILPILRTIEPHMRKIYGKHPGASISLRYDRGYWLLWTTIPDIDFTHDTEWKDTEPLSAEDDAALRKHLIKILQIWLDQDELFSPPIEKQRIAGMFDKDIKTINRWLKAGTIHGFALNKDLIRILKTDMPQK